jgi:hypothetical protein
MRLSYRSMMAFTLAWIFASAGAVQGAPLDPTGWTATEGVNSGWPGNAIKGINGAGLSYPYHDPGIYDNWGDVWFTQSTTGNPSINTFPTGNIWLMIDMQAVKDVGTIEIWNFGDPASHPNGFNQGANNIDIYYTTSGTLPTTNTNYGALTGWTHLINVNLNPAPTNFAPSLMSDSLDVTDFSARYVLIGVNSRHGSNTYSENSVSIAEIRFLEAELDAEIVPEPSTFILGALGLAGLGFAAWRRRRGRGLQA